MLIPITISIFTVLLSGVESSAILYNESVQETGVKECMKGSNCFSIADEFKNLLPFFRKPQNRATINTKFRLYTKRNPKEYHLLTDGDKDSFDESELHPKDPTIFIVHGFMDGELYGPWMVKMKDEFIMHGEYNIIIVDWSGGNKPPYSQATVNTVVVGEEIATIIQALEKYKGIKRENCHIIGHSLGAHIAGFAGSKLGGKLGRITGCDPAAPYFQNMPPSIRLDPTDANFVDVIHSDAVDSNGITIMGFGMSQLVGHVDFFPNNGRHQPGCPVDKFTSFITDGLTEGLRRFVSCNHQRALDFMHYSINYRKVTPVGYQCTGWKDFLSGNCAECGSDNKRCAIMGIRAAEYKEFRNNSVQRAMYLETSGRSSFWLYHYQVSIKLHKPKTKYKDVKGKIDVTLFGSKADVLAHVQKKVTDLIHGATYKFLVTTDKQLGDIKSLSLKWFSSSVIPDILGIFGKPNLYVEYITVIPMNVIEKSPRNMTNRVFCDKPNKAIQPRTVTNFYRDNNCLKLL